ncbi:MULTISPECIES: hypothetical protein [Pectobacterium]|uniref:hypothetical protein n=1 Tax=Pectobacterium TaxID=122277 RepID=UPI0019695086|nr:hypothetical protein [Pectobacterium brasiliense]MBN3042687.1 hypothetical protein [Pectobacterium brasiliense]MBN3124812.1 hypothetical protein [Pectobacterium brasiliense]MBN3142957.1 hypothetical protein [Pectobacterium brasiliense]QSD24987.1 hypothetical protein H5A38_02765 [Pectobacterium brasiliense]
MRKARFTEHQIIAVLKSVGAGRTDKDACHQRWILVSLVSAARRILMITTTTTEDFTGFNVR